MLLGGNLVCDLRIKAQELLQVRQNEKEYKDINEDLSEEADVKFKKDKSKKIFTDKIQKEIDNFQVNLLEAADNAQPLKIEILRLDGENLVSWWDERDSEKDNIYTDYAPIKSGIITFIDDINLELLTDDIIIDSTLQKLYDTISANDIYPEWSVKKVDDKIESLYLEINPLISYRAKKENLRREETIKQRALVVSQKYDRQTQKVEEEEKSGKLEKVKIFITTFIPVLYFSVIILTILSGAFEFTPMSGSSFVEVVWPYFLLSEFSTVGELFILSLPLGVLIALYSAYKKS